MPEYLELGEKFTYPLEVIFVPHMMGNNFGQQCVGHPHLQGK